MEDGSYRGNQLGGICHVGLPWWLSGKKICLQCRRCGFDPWVGKIPWKRKWLPTPVFLLKELYGMENPIDKRNLVGCSPWGHKESDMTEQLKLLLSQNYYQRKILSHSITW